MATPHINAKPNAFAKTVLMPGDPKRAQWIAETFLERCELVNDVRGILGYTGYTKNGKKVSVMASGMGLPSIGIYSHELFTAYGVESIIRIGTCGAYQENINVRDVLICQAASTDSNWASQFNLGGGSLSAIADYELLDRSVKAANAHGVKVQVGNILSSDVFYNADSGFWKRWAALGVMGVEMESYSLYITAARLGKKALCILTVSDHFLKKEILTSTERQNSLVQMIEIALDTAI